MSTLAYFVNQLDNLDTRLYEPLYSTTWGRDIKLRSGISMANESTSFIRSMFGGIGTQTVSGKPWLSGNSTTLPGVSINGERIVLPLRLLGQELSYSSVELERSQMVGQSIDVQKFTAMNAMYQMHTDEMVYTGDTTVGATGLVNSALVSTGSVAADGTGGLTAWSTKTADLILRDVNDMINAAWTATGFAACPNKLLLPPAAYALVAGKRIGDYGGQSILGFLEDNSISLRVNGTKLDIQPCKWLTGRGAGATNRMVCYTNDENHVRFPMVPIRRETPYNLGINFHAPYIWAFGELEWVYPETALYRDGI